MTSYSCPSETSSRHVNCVNSSGSPFLAFVHRLRVTHYCRPDPGVYTRVYTRTCHGNRTNSRRRGRRWRFFFSIFFQFFFVFFVCGRHNRGLKRLPAPAPIVAREPWEKNPTQQELPTRRRCVRAQRAYMTRFAFCRLPCRITSNREINVPRRRCTNRVARIVRCIS